MFGRGPDSLEAGIDFRLLGPHIGVAFEAERLAGAEVLWLNERWWLDQGIDIVEPAVRGDIERWLLERFAVASCEVTPDTAEVQAMLADRYGGSFGSNHGGSGRCGTVGRFHAKGIGATPLVSPPRVGPHRDGRLALAEAIREAVSAELVHAELPFGSVPVIAIIGANHRDQSRNADAIIVRPNFIRPAHFERSIFFGTAGTHQSDQHCDALRTRAAVETTQNAPQAIGFPGLLRMLHRCAIQLGAAQAHRLWQGRFLTSNVTVSGALVDFGSFRTVPSWRAFFGEPEEVFGREIDYLAVAWRSLSHAFQKYAPTQPLSDEAEARAELNHGLVDGFRNAIARTLHLEDLPAPASERLLQALTDYFQEQQGMRCQIAERDNWQLPWIHDLLRHPSAAPLTVYASERKLLGQINEAKRETSSLSQAAVAGLGAALDRWLCQRPRLYYETSSPNFTRVGVLMSRRPHRRKVILDRYMSFVLSSVSRTWSDLPPHFEISGQTCRGGSTVLYGFDHREGCRRALVRGAGSATSRRVFGALVSQEGGAQSCWLRLPAAADSHLTGLSLGIGKNRVTLPPALFRYDRQNSLHPFIGRS